MKRAFCNELVQDNGLEELSHLLSDSGFQGIELDPWSLCGERDRLSPRDVDAARRATAAAGLTITGFHWLLRRPAGLNLLADDEWVRRHSWDALRTLTRACSDAGGSVMTIGSGPQRRREHLTRREARDVFAQELTRLVVSTQDTGVVFCVESLPAHRSNAFNTMAEVTDLMQAAGLDRVRLAYDFHNAVDETESWAALASRYGRLTGHVHVNRPDGGCPAPDETGYRPAFRELSRSGYQGWVSVELFRLDGDPTAVIRRAAAFLDTALGYEAANGS